MSDLITKCITNYASITDVDGFLKLMERTETDDGEPIEVFNWETPNSCIETNNLVGVSKIHGFACNGINGLRVKPSKCKIACNCGKCDNFETCDHKNDSEVSYDTFIEALQEYIRPGDAMVIKTIYFQGTTINAYAEIISHDDISSISLNIAADEVAKKILSNDRWQSIWIDDVYDDQIR